VKGSRALVVVVGRAGVAMVMSVVGGPCVTIFGAVMTVWRVDLLFIFCVVIVAKPFGRSGRLVSVEVVEASSRVRY
jgi:hypothetical protein